MIDGGGGRVSVVRSSRRPPIVHTAALQASYTNSTFRPRNQTSPRVIIITHIDIIIYSVRHKVYVLYRIGVMKS